MSGRVGTRPRNSIVSRRLKGLFELTSFRQLFPVAVSAAFCGSCAAGPDHQSTIEAPLDVAAAVRIAADYLRSEGQANSLFECRARYEPPHWQVEFGHGEDVPKNVGKWESRHKRVTLGADGRVVQVLNCRCLARPFEE